MKSNVFIIMGVSGCGKSTIGKLLSQELNIPFFDGDDYHPQENITKMSAGIPLNDGDRKPWLETLNSLAKTNLKTNSCIIVCSALKEKYREILSKEIKENVKWVHLKGDFHQILERVNKRENHFMSVDLLQSQFDILEFPKNALDVDISLQPNDIVKFITKMMTKKSEFGLFGLGVMGKSLSRNLALKGFKISIFNREVKGKEENIAIDFKNEHKELSTASPFSNIEDFVNSLQIPRKILLMVNAGKITDNVIEDLIPFLSKDDILIDGGNSNFKKTKERYNYLKSKNINFIGIGVSGGEEGALKGPSIMPSGDKNTYEKVKPFLEKIAAKDSNNLPCCTYIGEDGSGHFIKMVHNGIEYVEMQLLAEVYSIFSKMDKNPDEIAAILESWKSKANSYLLEITIAILRKKENNNWLIHKIVDKAGNKGTGNWTAITTAELGVPSTMIPTALFARYSSFYKEERIKMSNNFITIQNTDLSIKVDEVFEAYQFARIINHYQGFKLMNEASKTNNWSLNLSEIARIWTNGCIIRSILMQDLVTVFKEADNLLAHSSIIKEIELLKSSTKKVVADCILNEVPVSCLSEAVNFFNMHKTANSSANIIQAQRDFFGAHTYQRTDDNSGKFYHTNWN